MEMKMKMKMKKSSFLVGIQLIYSNAFTPNYVTKNSKQLMVAPLFMSNAPQAISQPPSNRIAADIINTILYPESEYMKRMDVGVEDQVANDECDGSMKIYTELFSGDDAQLSLTYHEFPLKSMNQLLQLSAQEYREQNGDSPNVLVDLGSGCGRLVLYAALASNDGENYISWREVHGIEIGDKMHEYALNIVERGTDEGYLCNPDDISTDDPKSTEIHFHRGAASELKHILSHSDIIFCYSTVFDCVGFNVDMSAMVLSNEWSLMLAEACSPGTVVITTDRALNPEYGWKLKHSLEVENPSLMSSTGYISIRR